MELLVKNKKKQKKQKIMSAAKMDIGSVYNQIATDFSRTRYKVWPCVASFLDLITTGAGSYTIAEIGCGNGKNLVYLRNRLVSVSRQSYNLIGVDISAELLKICQGQGIEVVLGSILAIPLLDGHLDYTLSIAVIHHLPMRKDRIQALKELARVTRVCGRILITVWARKQTTEDGTKCGKRQFSSNDEMVGFKTTSGETHYRYYHLYDDGELADDLAQVPELQVAKLFIEKGNYIAELIRI
jgi:ubiquinone/menaquinone biosynthesis C-methylase UbiE